MCGEEALYGFDGLAKDVSAVHVLVERELGSHLLCGGNDALVEGRRETWEANLNNAIKPMHGGGELARGVVVCRGYEFLVLD